jgi:hypothetical protein
MKKNTLATFLLIGILTSITQTHASGDPNGNGLFFLCAPEIEQTNISVTDNLLQELAMTELSDSTKFRALVNQAKGLNEQQRMNAYLNLVGVSNDKEIVDFIGSREIDKKYISALETNAGLNEEQARLVITKLTSALLGQVK